MAIGGLIAGGIGLVSGLFGGGESKEERRARRRMDRAADDERGRSRGADARAVHSRGDTDESRTQYLNRLGGFDPDEYLERKTGAILDRAGETYGEMEAGREVSNNRRGFLGSPRGSGRMTRDLNSRVARELSDAAFSTAQLEQGNIDRYGDTRRMDQQREQFDRGAAEDTRRNYLDLLAGNRDAATDRGNSRRGAWGNALSGAASLYAMGR